MGIEFYFATRAPAGWPLRLFRLGGDAVEFVMAVLSCVRARVA